MTVEVDYICDWVQQLDDSIFENYRFQKIMRFFVIDSPVNGLSIRKKDLNSYGWSKPWNKEFYLNKQLKELSTNEKLIFSAHTYADMEEALTKAEVIKNFPNDTSIEKIVIYNNKNNQFISTFYHIRNSIAHGRFNVIFNKTSEDWIFIFEDGMKNPKNGKFKVSARMILKCSTLLSWIELIKGGEKPYKSIS